MNKKIIENMKKHNKDLSVYACKDESAFRLKKESNDMRTPFFRDIDRIIYSLSYTRYIDKTQVFSLNENDNISKRMTHVQMVSKIARTIGRALGLNEDLIEACALGHDLGHVPFGHTGEAILNDLSLAYNEGYFNHNIQSVRILRYLENNGQGTNITLQVLDGIMCHNGELELQRYEPVNKTFEQFDEEYQKSYIDKTVIKKLKPMTLEGCVVRICDIIAYIGRDIEDAIRLGVIKVEDIPEDIRSVVGTTNREIINTFILDVVSNSIDKPYLKMSDNLFKMLVKLKKFNYENIYAKANSKEDIELYKRMFNKVFVSSLEDLDMKNVNSNIYKVFLNDKSLEYRNSNTHVRMVIDYIAGMTDDYLIRQYNELVGGLGEEE